MFLVYLVLFHAAWAGWAWCVYPRAVALGTGTLAYAVVSIGIRLVVWVLPVVVYVRYVDGVDVLTYLKLRQNWRRGVALGVGFGAIGLVLSVARFGVPHPNGQVLTWNNVLGTSVVIGLVEETPYRGFILRKLRERWGAWRAILASSLLFIGVHVPGWIALHLLKPDVVAAVFVLGVVFSVLVLASGSLWSAIVVHDLNDFLGRDGGARSRSTPRAPASCAVERWSLFITSRSGRTLR